MAATTQDETRSGTEPCAEQKGVERPRSKCRLISVEPIVFLLLAVQGTLVNLRTQYVEARLAEDYNYTLPGPGNCSTGNSSSDATGKRIESETALWVMYMKSVSVFIPIFTGTILIAASDFVGRKPILIINALGHLLATVMFLLLAWLNLPLVVAVAAECMLGISGDSITSMHVSFAYVADTSTGKSRTVRLVALSMLTYAGFGMSQILVDLILQQWHNYVLTFACGLGFALLNVLYVATPGLVLETVLHRSAFKVGRIVKNLFKGILALLSVRSERRHLRILLVIATFTVNTLIIEAVFSVITIYGLGVPFCWSPTLVGIYNVIVNTYPALVALVVIKPLLFCVSAYWIIIMGFLSGMAIQIVTATAKTNAILVYAAVAAGSLRTIPDGILEDFLSKLVSSHEHGVAFALLSLLASVGKVISPLLLNAVYAKMVLVEIAQVTFYIAAAIYVVPVALLCILWMCSRPFEGKSLQIQSGEEGGPLIED